MATPEDGPSATEIAHDAHTSLDWTSTVTTVPREVVARSSAAVGRTVIVTVASAARPVAGSTTR